MPAALTAPVVTAGNARETLSNALLRFDANVETEAMMTTPTMAESNEYSTEVTALTCGPKVRSLFMNLVVMVKYPLKVATATVAVL
ncbi:MAG TPA: hypothetical protein PLT25_10610 [Acidocella sp.]|nr:hypothetical protein [Acidocella sp.]HQU05151.1 hypothetical protein [Acidocella sp.]